MAESIHPVSGNITLKQLSRGVADGHTPIVEVESQDGIYIVRLHYSNGIAELSDEHGKTRTFLGTGEIRDLLSETGLTHGVLTWADQCGDEMIGVPGHAITPDEMLAYGTRISFR